MAALVLSCPSSLPHLKVRTLFWLDVFKLFVKQISLQRPHVLSVGRIGGPKRVIQLDRLLLQVHFQENSMLVADVYGDEQMLQAEETPRMWSDQFWTFS